MLQMASPSFAKGLRRDKSITCQGQPIITFGTGIASAAEGVTICDRTGPARRADELQGRGGAADPLSRAASVRAGQNAMFVR